MQGKTAPSQKLIPTPEYTSTFWPFLSPSVISQEQDVVSESTSRATLPESAFARM
jgi:hypothetical protein